MHNDKTAYAAGQKDLECNNVHSWHNLEELYILVTWLTSNYNWCIKPINDIVELIVSIDR